MKDKTNYEKLQDDIDKIGKILNSKDYRDVLIIMTLIMANILRNNRTKEESIEMKKIFIDALNQAIRDIEKNKRAN